MESKSHYLDLLVFLFVFLLDDAMKKIVKDQEEFEKEHQFMQVYIKKFNVYW